MRFSDSTLWSSPENRIVAMYINVTHIPEDYVHKEALQIAYDLNMFHTEGLRKAMEVSTCIKL
jgi:hypothetical protein